MIDQRKTVSIVFADLVDSTSLAERLDPEILSAVLQRYFGALRGVVEQHGGRVEKFIGDAVVGIFGVPMLHEDDALRAVRAGFGMQGAIEDLNGELIGDGLAEPLRIRVGVNTGEVVVSAENALGHAISMAARLEQAAASGDVLIGAQTYALVSSAVEAEPIDPLTVKGSALPIDAWRVTGIRDMEARGSRAGAGFVGRARELHAIQSAFERAVEESTCVSVTVVAPPGLGKSRLIAEAVARMSADARVIGGRCLPYGESVTYAPMVDAVRQLEIAEGAEVIDRLLAAETDGQQVVASVRATMSSAARGSPDETAWAFRRLFDALAAQRPLVVVVDDLHWADPLLLDLLEYVATFSIGHPMLLLYASRPDLFETRPGWGASSQNSQVLRLAPLTQVETVGLLAGLESDELDADTRRRIVETSGGVPLFIEQMAAFDADVAGASLVPPTIRALLAARVDRLPSDQRAILQHAAIEGPVFHRDTLASLMPEDARTGLGSGLLTLIRNDFVRPQVQLDGRDAFAFNHALIRDAVYEAMSRRLRADLHERYAALVLEAPGSSDEVVAHHLAEAHRERTALGESGSEVAGLARRAGLALASAGRKATARKESSRAVELLSRAEDMLRADPAARVSILADLIDALVAVPDMEAADAVYARAVDDARAVGDVANELRAEMAWMVGDARRDTPGWQQRVLELTGRATEHFTRMDAKVSLAQALLLRSLAQAYEDYRAAIETLTQAHATAMQTTDERIQVEAWDDLGGMMLSGPTPYEEVREFCRREVEWARTRGIAFAVADGRLGEAYALAALDEPEQALAILQELGAFFAQLPSLVSQYGECHTLAGRIERDRDNPRAAAAQYRRAMELFDKGGQARWWRSAAPGLAHALIDEGRLDEAKQVLDELSATDEGVAPSSFAMGAQARYVAALGDVTGAVSIAQQAVAAVSGNRAVLYEGRARETLAELLSTAGRTIEARDEWQRARELYVAKGFVTGVARIDKNLSASAP